LVWKNRPLWTTGAFRRAMCLTSLKLAEILSMPVWAESNLSMTAWRALSRTGSFAAEADVTRTVEAAARSAIAEAARRRRDPADMGRLITAFR
jgi:hypothetical protein